MSIAYGRMRNMTLGRMVQPRVAAAVPRRRKIRRLTTPYQRVTRQVLSGLHSFKRVINCGSEYTQGNLTFTAGTHGVLSTTGGLMKFLMQSASNNTPNYASFGYLFNIAALPGITDFTNLFDSYQIRKVVVKITPYSNVSQTNKSTDANYSGAAGAILHYAIDKDDVTHPTATEAGIEALQQRTGYKTANLVTSKPITITVLPRYQQTAYRTGITSAYTQGNRNAWLDMAYTDIPHYGIIGVIEGISPNANDTQMWFRVETSYYLRMKTVR